MRGGTNTSVVDLSDHTDFTFALLDDTWAWRHRLVERFTLGSVWDARVESTYQIEMPSALMASFLPAREPRAEAVRALLPVTTRSKQILLGFGIRAEGGGAHRLSRLSIASIQAEYLTRLVRAHPLAQRLQPGLAPPLLEAIGLFMPAVYRQFDPEVSGSPDAVAAYLTAGLGFPVSPDNTQHWLDRLRSPRQLLVDALEEPPDDTSSSENVLLAIPSMAAKPHSTHDVSELVERYSASVETAAAGGQDILAVLGEYGRRWEVIVEMEVPLHAPTTVTIIEQRRLGPLRRGRTVQRFALGDARTGHAEFHVSDHAVVLAKNYGVKDLLGRTVAVPIIEDVRDTSESLALYSSDPTRPYYVDVELRLKPAFAIRAVTWALLLLVYSATVAALLVDGPDKTDALGVLSVPTTFAVALLLVREQSSLAARLQRLWRFLLLMGTALLWTVVLVRLA
jgi:hypothetical protein